MLQNLLGIILIFVGLLFDASSAQAILFQAPDVSFEDFQKYSLLKNHPTYTQWVRQTLQENQSEAKPQILEFSQQALKEGLSKKILADWEILRTNLDLNKEDREILFLLAEKLRHQNEICRYFLLDPDLAKLSETPLALQDCHSKAVSFPSDAKEKLSTQDLLMIDGIIYAKTQIPPKLIPGVYQWKIISDKYEDIAFAGTAQALSENSLQKQYWVEGNCLSYKFRQKDFSILSQSQIYFDDHCISSGNPPNTSPSQLTVERKSMIWAAAILLTGAAAYQLRDKTLVLTFP